MSDFLPKIVTPDDVRASKARLDAFARAFDRSVAACRTLDPATRRGWSDFYVGWRAFADREPSWMHAAAEYDAAERYEEHLIGWQAYLGRVCPLGTPPLTRPAGGSSTLETTVKTVAIAGAVAAVALALRSVIR